MVMVTLVPTCTGACSCTSSWNLPVVHRLNSTTSGETCKEHWSDQTYNTKKSGMRSSDGWLLKAIEGSQGTGCQPLKRSGVNAPTWRRHLCTEPSSSTNTHSFSLSKIFLSAGCSLEESTGNRATGLAVHTSDQNHTTTLNDPRQPPTPVQRAHITAKFDHRPHIEQGCTLRPEVVHWQPAV